MSKDKNKTKNDVEWEKIFDDFNVLEKVEKNGIFEITSDDIKRYREPRLMTKFDHRINLPSIFCTNKLSILPNSRGSYIISDFKNYHKLESINEEFEYVKFPSNIQSIDINDIFSETVAVNCAYITSILSDFLGEEILYPTIEGRMSSSTFDFKIESLKSEKIKTLTVKNSQIEIDGAYEGVESLALIEAKRDLSEDFLIRQLYYPFRLCKENMSITKKIRPIFFIYSNGLFSLYEYEFSEWSNYNSVRLVKKKNYSIEDREICKEDITNILHKVEIIKESSEISFPQANNLARIINICELLTENSLSREDITMMYDFNARQTSYYTDAGIYLGLIEKNNVKGIILYSLTSYGEKIMKLNYKEKQLAFCNSILAHRVFNDALKYWLKNGKISVGIVAEEMKKSGLNRVKSDETFKRRASTIKAWLEWVIGLTNTY